MMETVFVLVAGVVFYCIWLITHRVSVEEIPMEGVIRSKHVICRKVSGLQADSFILLVDFEDFVEVVEVKQKDYLNIKDGQKAYFLGHFNMVGRIFKVEIWSY